MLTHTFLYFTNMKVSEDQMCTLQKEDRGSTKEWFLIENDDKIENKNTYIYNLKI